MCVRKQACGVVVRDVASSNAESAARNTRSMGVQSGVLVAQHGGVAAAGVMMYTI